MATRFVSPSDQSPGFSSSPISQPEAQDQARAPAPVQAHPDAEVAFVGDNIRQPLPPSHSHSATIDDDEPYLAALVNGEFSSPSSYPSFLDPMPHLSPSQTENRNRSSAAPQLSRPQPSAPWPSANTAPRDPSSACINLNFTAPQRTTSQLSSSTTAGESQSTLHTLDSFDESTFLESPSSSFSDNMPRSVRQPRAAPATQDAVHTSKRRRTSVNTSPTTQLKTPSSRTKTRQPASKDFDDLFESPPPQATPGAEPLSDLPTIDLTEANEVPEELKAPVEDKRIKLSAFQCVICMDDVTGLTVTHCGHLYCAQCLHSSLHVEATKGKCPMCRQKLDMKPREAYNSKTKGFWPLELKLMTATRKGKRKADAQA